MQRRRPAGLGRTAGTLTTCALVVLTGVILQICIPVAPAGAATSATTLYRDALATTRSWTVHYVSSSTASQKTLVLAGDAGPAAGSQTVTQGAGHITIEVIGETTYIMGNATGLENLAGLSAAQAAQSAGQWIEFATSDTAFSSVVAGVRSADVAKELELTGPLTLGRDRVIDGVAVDAVKGTQTFGHTRTTVVLYVRARGSHHPVEEDSLGSTGHTTSAEHVTYSDWGEHVRPEAPRATFRFGSVGAT